MAAWCEIAGRGVSEWFGLGAFEFGVLRLVRGGAGIDRASEKAF